MHNQNFRLKMGTFALLLGAGLAHADLDKDQQRGLSDTQHLLTSPGERNEFIKKDKGAQDVDAKVEALTGKAGKEDVYGLSSQVMEKLTTESGGDSAKMQTMLMEAQKNPEAFYNKYFSADQKAKVKAIATKADQRAPATSPRD